MSKWSLGDVLLTAGTGGLYGAAKLAGDNQANNQAAQENAAYNRNIYNQSLQGQAAIRAEEKKKKMYGNTLDSLGAETEQYVSSVKDNLGKNVARADLYNQQAGQQRALQNAKANIRGVDTTAMNEQAKRSAQFGAAGVNEAAKREALDIYGKSLSNRMTGSNQIDQLEIASALGQMQMPETNYNPGLLGQIFGGFI